MPGRFAYSPDYIIGAAYSLVADYPNSLPVAVDNNRCVFMGKGKVFLVESGIVVDYFDWEPYGSQYWDVQRIAQKEWGLRWMI